MNYGRAVKIARSIAGMSQEELAVSSCLDRSYLSLIESGKRTATVQTLNQISKAMDIPFHLLTLLATEREDAKCIDEGQVQRLATELARLLIEEKDEDVRSSHQTGGGQPKRSRISARHKKRSPERATK